MEYFTIQNIITQLAIKRLNIAVLPWTAGGNVQRLNIIYFKPFLNRICNKLRTIESCGPRVVTRKQYDDIVAVQRKKKLKFKYSIGYVIEERF